MKYRSVSDPSHFDTKTSIVDENNRIVAQVVDERQAALIAAAPDLLEAMETCRDWFRRWSPTAPCIDGADRIHPMLEMIEKSIAKAEGRESNA